MKTHTFFPAALAAATLLAAPVVRGDETCNSPYMSKLIKGQEDYVYVWTLGVEGLGDGSDKLVTVDADPKSKTYGKVLAQVSVGTRGEAHHMGFTDDRRRIWAGGLSGADIYVFDIATDPARPKLVKTIKDLAARTGYIGPHTYYALPGRMLVQALSNEKDKGGVTGMALYNNEGEFIARYAMPVDNGGDGYGYDLAVNPTKNVMLTSSFTGYANYMRPLGELIKDEAAMKRFGNTMVAWDLKAMKPTTVMQVPGAPLEIRWSLHPGDDWAITAAALTSKLWLVRPGAGGQWQAKEVATIGDPTKIPLPVDISIRSDGKGLWVNTFMDGMTRYFDLTNPQAPKQTYEKHTGAQVNMISQSWDGTRVYITSSLLANWDKGGADNEQFLRGFKWDGKELTPAFEVDFTREKLGRAHHMKLGSKVLRTAYVAPAAAPGRFATSLVISAAAAVLWLAAAPPTPKADAPPRMDFVLPAPGTYQLQRIMRAPDGPVLTVEGKVDQLSHFTRERITLLGFIYTSCTDPQGCPLAYRVFDRLSSEIRSTPALKDKVQLVTLSFDPARDTPEVMRRYAGSQLEDEGGLRWFFLTTPSERELMPLVEGFGQDVQYAVDNSTGRPFRQLSHVLKVFLIDRAGDVREIYTSTFLHPEAIIGDIQTLLME